MDMFHLHRPGRADSAPELLGDEWAVDHPTWLQEFSRTNIPRHDAATGVADVSRIVTLYSIDSPNSK